MKTLEYSDIDYSKVRRQYDKIVGCLERDDFRSAAVKKLSGHDLYSARLDDANRLVFKLVQYKQMRYALLLEVVLNHAYDKSKFLRGTKVDEAKMLTIESPSEIETGSLPQIVYVNPADKRFHFLDKIVSFDSEQAGIYHAPCPLILIGPAGSGKTVLTLEKMKLFHGEGLYVTLSPYLSESARRLYYSHYYDNKQQDISFLSFKEYLETIRVPDGKEMNYSAFAQWLGRFPRLQRVADPHGIYEEFRGVITGSTVDKPYLSREDYISLGLRQSIYLDAERELVYDLFEKYLVFLKESGLYDPNILAHGYIGDVRQIYDFVVVDEVQDITNIQLQLIFRSLKNPAHFMLCGDSNQIVHPNFFSWGGLKSMLYHSAELETAKVTRILQSNFRNSRAITEIANRLIRIKQKRFGSIDKESTYLMNSLAEKSGEVVYLRDTDKVKNELNKHIRRSTKVAVVVMRHEDKALARKHFDTPLLFTVQEAKGLEYENVVLFNFVSGERLNFQEIVRGVAEEDMGGDLLYMRAADKTDKSREAYKFYINSLYVAITRAVQRLYIVESDTTHRMLQLLGLNSPVDQLTMTTEQSTNEEWQAEARKLELQGKQEQAEEIKRSILKTQAVPWDTYTHTRVEKLVSQIRTARDNPQKPRKALFEYALFYDVPALIRFLSEHGYDKARLIYSVGERRQFFSQSLYEQQKINLEARVLLRYAGVLDKEVVKQCGVYGIDHRTEFNVTSLMLAARAGNVALIKGLLSAGANADITDNYGMTAWQIALKRAITHKDFGVSMFFQTHNLLSPSSVSLKVEERLIKLSSNQGEFLLFHALYVLLMAKISVENPHRVAITAANLADFMGLLPDSVIPAYRKKRQYISGLLAKNEVNSQNSYGKQLFTRISMGYYILNPNLYIRVQDEWLPICSFAKF